MLTKDLLRVKQLILFTVTFMIRVVIWLSDLPARLGWVVYDTHIYLNAGREYVKGLLTGDLSKFQVNIEHPPLGKLLIGLVTQVLGINVFQSAILLMCFFSAATSIVIYRIGLRYSARVASLAWLLYTIDPFSIALTCSWLETPMNFFLTLSFYYLIELTDSYSRGNLLKTVTAFSLAVLTKYTAIPYIILFLIFYRIPTKSIKRIIPLTSIMFFTLNPQLWSVTGIRKVIEVEASIGNIPFWGAKKPFIVGERVVYAWFPGRLWFNPTTFFWTFDFYFGLNYLHHPNQPFIMPFLCFILLTYRLMKKEKLVSKSELTWLGITLINFIFFTKFYPYYSVTLLPSLSILAATLTLGHTNTQIIECRRISVIAENISLILIMFSPLALVISITYAPAWFFILTLIINARLFPLESIICIILTASLTIISCIMATLARRRVIYN